MGRGIIIFIVFTIWIAILFVGELINALLELSRCRKYKRITAKVIDVQERVGYERYSGMVHYYRPTYCYEVDGVVYESQSSYEYSNKLYSVGDTEVLYCDINNPKRYAARGEEYWKIKVHKVILAICIWLLLWLFILLKSKF